MSKKWKIISLIIVIISLFFIFYPKPVPVLSLSVSSDGRYVISAHAGRDADRHKPIGKLVLWDIERKEKKVLAKNANAFSAAFVPDSHEFIWQDDKNVVHIQDVNGKEINSFPHFQVKTHIISADKTFYLSSNMESHGQLYKGYGKDLIPVYTDGGFPFPLTLSMSENYFLSASNACFGDNDPVAETNLTANPINPSSSKKGSYDEVTLWDRHTLKPFAILNGNCGKTTGLISPDGNWVVTGDENSGYYMWEIKNLHNRLKLAIPGSGIYVKEKHDYDSSKLLPIPPNIDNRGITAGGVAYAFLSEKDFIGLGKSENEDGNGYEFAALYTVGDPWIKAYVEIGNNPSISTNYYQRNLSVSSAPKAHVLVTGQATGGGINVYKYHPDKMELEKIWVAD
ncbi:WD40 repeat domain-containing protein [Exercitatus varius]|uniref:WD40 repeat domain-containing protein n=1 Tax=Exercitatus varius TaxID=67857 RepID=A0AAW6QEU5_9PAST|nr:WD40 repeat domain-containing protein [Exercitatus varius]MDG2950734.1 WD40 repeat domain-containing protein [Exercitatus varius]